MMRFSSCQNANLSLPALMRSKVKNQQECMRMSDIKGDFQGLELYRKSEWEKVCAKGSDITMPIWIVVITSGR